MRCKIADLIAEIPEAGGMAPRCRDYLYESNKNPDIVIRAEAYGNRPHPASFSEENIAYMESCRQFYRCLLDFEGFYLHSSAVMAEGNVFLFSGFSGVGKSTHVRLWQQLPELETTVINDDKPALRRIDGTWIAYGTPWCGKDGINANASGSLAGICFLMQAKQNKIRRLSAEEAMPLVLAQTIWKLSDARKLDKLLHLLEQLLEEIPIYELENLPEPAAAALSYETMRQGAKEAT